MASIYRRNGSNGRYRVKFRGRGGRWHDVLGFNDFKASEEMGRKLEQLASLRSAGESPGEELSRFIRGLPEKLQTNLARWGLLDSTAFAGTKPLLDHLADYRSALLSGTASSAQRGPATRNHVDLTCGRVRSVLDAIGARTLSDVSSLKVGNYLLGRRAKGLSAKSSNHYLQSCKSFLSWMVRTGRATQNPLAGVATINVTQGQRKHVRRPLEHEEGKRLLNTTRNGPDRRRMPAEERYWLYRLALETGLRSSELRALTRANFELDVAEPFVWLEGDDTKNRMAAELPLRSGTVDDLRSFLAGKHPKAVVFPDMPPKQHISAMLRQDLAAADIPYRTDSGVVDFHSLRGTCLSWLANANTPLKVLQDFARHSTPTLTMNVYARSLRGSLAGAAALLPDLSGPGKESVRATGTDGKAVLQTTPKTTPNGSQKRAIHSNGLHDESANVTRSGTHRKHYENRERNASKCHKMYWARQDSNLRRHTPTGLQPVPFGQLGHTPIAVIPGWRETLTGSSCERAVFLQQVATQDKRNDHKTESVVSRRNRHLPGVNANANPIPHVSTDCDLGASAYQPV